MLQEYRQYITNLRNNLIQCGVEYPVTPLETYEELFYESSNLEQVLWYFSVMSICNSENALQDYFIPLSGYFKEKVREQMYTQFQRTTLREYKNLSALSASIENRVSNEVPAIAQESTDSYDEETEFDLFPESEDTQEEQEGSIDEEPATSTSQITAMPVITTANSFRESLLSSLKETESAPHGVYLEDLESSDPESKSESASHGVFLDDLDEKFSENTCQNEGNSIYLNIGVSHGIYLEDVELEETSDKDFSEESSKDEEWYEETTTEEYDDEDYDEYEEEVETFDEEEVYEESEFSEEEDFEEDSDEVVETFDADDEDEYDEYEEYEETVETIDEDSEDEEDFEEYEETTETWDEEDEFEETVETLDDEDEYEETVETIDEDSEDFEEEYEETVETIDEDGEEEYEEYEETVETVDEDEEEERVSPKPKSPSNHPKDLSDYLVDGTNSFLTRIKVGAVKVKNNIKNG